MLALISWAPFILAAFIPCIVFMVKGYKRGIARAGISIASTALSAVFAVLLSKLISGIVGSSLSSLVSDMLSGIEMAALISAELIAGLSTSVIALVLFIPIFFLVSLIVKLVVSGITGKYVKNAANKGLKWGGLGVSLVDALLFAFILLIPVYGTLSLAGQLVGLIPSEEGDPTVEMVVELTEAPLAKVAGVPPFSTIYDSLMSFDMNGSGMSISSTLKNVGKIGDLLNDLGDTDPAKKSEAIVEMVNTLELTIKENPALAEAICGFIKNADLGEEMGFLADYTASLTPENLEKEISAVASVVRSAESNGILAELTAEGEIDIFGVLASEKVTEGTFVYDLTAALNTTEGLAKLKAGLIKSVAGSLGDMDESGKIANAINSIPETPFTAEDVAKEGDSFLLIIKGGAALASGADDTATMAKGAAYLMEGIARHPSIGLETVKDIAGDIVGQMGAGGDGAAALVDKLTDNLEKNLAKPVKESTFAEFVESTLTFADAMGSIASGKNDNEGSSSTPEGSAPAKTTEEKIESILTTNPEVLKDMADVIADNTLADLGMSDNEQIGEIAQTLIEQIADANLNAEQAKEEAAALTESVEKIMSIATNENAGSFSEIIPDTEEFIDTITDSVIISATVREITKDENGEQVSNPFGLEMSASEKTALTNEIKDYYASAEGDKAALAETLNALCLLLGADPAIK